MSLARRLPIIGMFVASCGARSELDVRPCNDLDPGAPVELVRSFGLPGFPRLRGGVVASGRYTLGGALELTAADAGTSALSATLSIDGEIIQTAVRRDGAGITRGTYAFRVEQERIVLEAMCGSGLAPFNAFETDGTRLVLSNAVGATTDLAIWSLVRQRQ